MGNSGGLLPLRAAMGVAATAALAAFALLQPERRISPALLFMALTCYAGFMTGLARGRWRDGLLLVSSLLVVPTLAEAILVATVPPPAPAVHYASPIYRGDPMLGYTLIASKTTRADKRRPDGSTVFDVTYTIGEDGLRRTESNPDGPIVAFFFDSMTFGEGVEDAETLPQQFADQTGRRYRVLNLGVPGYGPQAMLRTLETGFRDELLRRPSFFVVQTAAWHAERAACRPDFVRLTPRYALVGGTPVFRGHCPEPTRRRGLRELNESQLYQHLIQPALVDRQHDLDLYLAVLRDSIGIAAQKYGARTMILYLRSADNQFTGTAYTDDRLIDELRQSGATVVDASRAEAGVDGLSIPGDGHPSAKANRLRAALLRGEIAKAAAPMPDRQ